MAVTIRVPHRITGVSLVHITAYPLKRVRQSAAWNQSIRVQQYWRIEICLERQTRGNNRLYYLSVYPGRKWQVPTCLTCMQGGGPLELSVSVCGRGGQGVHMLPQTKAMEVSGCLWLHCLCLCRWNMGSRSAASDKLHSTAGFLSKYNWKIKLSSFINLDNYSARVDAN